MAAQLQVIEGAWQPWFAWRPVRTKTGWAWLETVQRRKVSYAWIGTVGGEPIVGRSVTVDDYALRPTGDQP